MNTIALTFNDEPYIASEGSVELGTAELMRVLHELSLSWQQPVRATLFIVGERLQQLQRDNPQLVRFMAENHELANYSFTRPAEFHRLSIPEALQEVRQTHELIAQVVGRPPRFFRPPGGLISPTIEAAIRQEFPDYEITGWDRHDEKSTDSPQDYQQRVVRQARPQQVILMHAWRRPTLWSLRGLITQLRQQDYRCVSLDQLQRPMPRYGLRSDFPPDSSRPRIALTFDDDPKVLKTQGVKLGTLELLRVIEELNQIASPPIRVTFFVVGVNLQKAVAHHPEVIESMRAGGHEIQNHSYSHPSNFHQLSPETAVDEVRRNHDLIADIFGQQARYFRPPKGLISLQNHRAILSSCPGYQIVGWDRHDEKDSYQPQQLYKAVVSHAQDHQIVLLHVWYQNTLWAMRSIFEGLQHQRYQMVGMNDLNREPTLYGLKSWS